VIITNWHPISYRFGIIAAYCSMYKLFYIADVWHHIWWRWI